MCIIGDAKYFKLNERLEREFIKGIIQAALKADINFFYLIRSTPYLLFYVGLILRFTNSNSDEAFSAAKIVLVHDLEIWFIRSLGVLDITKNDGTKTGYDP
ncbi:unnamed protein product [Rotaria socialis]|uniref:Uncharacterized protein n=1 Tax=Rotaria socialis TaxID=392032 RepID=A0A817WGI2_9BILA|nr:unnamed protein product [Rotaria socialis]